MQTLLTLGDITLAGFEVPESLPFGGEQSLTVHELIGGERVVDAMGRSDMPMEWSGHFMGATALDRALYLNTQRVLGQPLVLSWSQMRFLVVIQKFEAHYQLKNRIPYSISCVVVADQVTPTAAGLVPDIDDQMNGDMDSANALGGLIDDGPLSGLLGTLGTAISAVSTFANATQATLNSVLQPIAAVQTRVGILLASAINTGQNVSTLGGILPNSSLSRSVANMSEQVVSFERQPALLSLQSVTGRMVGNLSGPSGNSRSITVAGGNLFDIASQQYGDATSWTAIAKANGLTDPVISGVQKLTVPTHPDVAGGVLGR